MITFSRLGHHGQLGNQLFQYAMLLGVAAKYGYQIRIPDKPNAKKKHGQTELHKFQITAGKLDKLHRIPEYHEKSFEFDPQALQQGDNTDFHGYYQSYKYFEHCAEKVRQEFRFIPEIEQYAKEYLNDSKAKQAVAIHIRRGDYLKRPDLFQNLNLQYYCRCLNKVQLSNRLIFSDDIEWCKETFGRIFFYVQTPSHWHDLAIMSRCRAHIISASSFSWWGAWLSGSEFVLAPYPWFPADGPRGNWNTDDIYPEHWTKINV